MPSEITRERELWDGIWQRETPRSFSPRHSLVLAAEKVLGDLAGKRVLELGAGRALDSIAMARCGATCFTVDTSRPSFAVSLSLAEASEVKIIPCQADAVRLPFKNDSFDLVFSQGLLEHGGLVKESLPEQIRVTKPGGHILIDVPHFPSVQAVVRYLALRLGKWPYGPEETFTRRRLKGIVEELGLTPVAWYGRGIVPILGLGIKGKMVRAWSAAPGSGEKDWRLGRVKAKDPARNLELGCLGSRVCNSIGVIAQKQSF